MLSAAPGTGDQHGSHPTPLFLDRHLHLDRLQRIVEFVARGSDDLVYYVHAPKDFAEDGVGSVQPAVVIDTDIELRAVIVGVARAVALSWNLCHADRAPFMRSIAGFRIQPIAGTAGPVQRTVSSLAQWVAALDDESWNDAMEGGAIIESHFGELEKVLDVARRVVRVEPNLDLAERRRNGNARIYFLKLHSHAIKLARTPSSRQEPRRNFELSVNVSTETLNRTNSKLKTQNLFAQPVSGLDLSHKIPPTMAMAAATPNETGQPH